MTPCPAIEPTLSRGTISCYCPFKQVKFFCPACSLKDFIYFKFNPQKYNSIFKFSLPALLTKPLYVSGHTNFMR